MKLTRLRKTKQEGERIPRWYGLAYYDFELDEKIYCPLPLNLIIATYRRIRIFFKFKLVAWIAKEESYGVRMYKRGFHDGVTHGRNETAIVHYPTLDANDTKV